MKDARWTTVAALTACLFPLAWLETGVALAQRSFGSDSRPEAEPPIRERTIDLQFPGGTVEEYISSVRDVTRSGDSPEGLNVVIDNPRAASSESLPPISLKRVRVDTAMELIEHVATSRDYRVTTRDLNPRGGDPVYVLSSKALSGPASRDRSEAEMRIEVFSIRDLAATEAKKGGDDADRFRVETILTALETALSMSESPVTNEQLRYHPESGLVFLYGTEEQIAVVRQTLDRMRGREESAGGEEYGYRYMDAVESHGRAAEAEQADPGASGFSYYGRAEKKPEAQPEDPGERDRRRYYYYYRPGTPGTPGTSVTQPRWSYGSGPAQAGPRGPSGGISSTPGTQSRHVEAALASAQDEIAALKQQILELKAALDIIKSQRPGGETVPNER